MSFGYWNDGGKFVLTSDKFSKYKCSSHEKYDGLDPLISSGHHGFLNNSTIENYKYHLWFVTYEDLYDNNYSDEIIKEVFPDPKLTYTDERLYVIIDRKVEFIDGSELLNRLLNLGYNIKQVKILCNNKFNQKKSNFVTFCWEFFHHGFILSQTDKDFAKQYSGDIKKWETIYPDGWESVGEFKQWLYKLPDFTKDIKRDFKCLFYNAVLHNHRLVMLGDMKRRKIQDNFLYSAYNRDMTSKEKLISNLENTKLVYNREIISYGKDLIETEIPKQLGNAFDGDQEVLNELVNYEHYNSTWFSLVAETTFSNSICTRLTEKTFKASMMHPFILAASPGSLQMFKDFGFKTFPYLFDESYDEIENHVNRLKFIMNQVDRVVKMDKIGFLDRIKKSYRNVKYNQEHWMNLHITLENYLLNMFEEMVE
jgi:hypothetical protein